MRSEPTTRHHPEEGGGEDKRMIPPRGTAVEYDSVPTSRRQSKNADAERIIAVGIFIETTDTDQTSQLARPRDTIKSNKVHMQVQTKITMLVRVA